MKPSSLASLLVVLALILGGAISYAHDVHVTTMYTDGNHVGYVPEGKKVVLVPHWWPLKEIKLVRGGAMYPHVDTGELVVEPEIPAECVGADQLAVSPAVFPAYCQQYFD